MLMMSVEKICEMYALKNALEFGKAEVNPLMRIILGKHSELRTRAKEVKEILERVVEEINKLKKEEIEKRLLKKYPKLLQAENSTVGKQEPEIDFIREMINEDIRTGRFGGRVHTRFPPEPNGYLHIGHAKSINLNYGIAQDYNGKFNLRFDDTNPLTEEVEYVNSIIEDVKWLGADFEDRLFFASDYFDKMFEYALQLVEKGLAYVDDSSIEQIRKDRGTLTQPGKESPYRNRSIEENRDLFLRMKNGEFPEGSKVLRAKIDMAHPNLLMRDPIIYRIIHASHHRTGDKWCIYPTYDWAHGLEDSIEGITHSICTLEFEVHRELYDWYLDQLTDEEGKPIYHPQQIEFARLNISHIVLSKRKQLRLVNEGYVRGWDDPRLLTIAGMRRGGITPEAIKKFTDLIGVTKRNTIIDRSIFDKCIREDLDERCSRVMAVLQPLKVVITNYPENKTETLTASNHPRKIEMGTRKIIFTRELYIERDDFAEQPPKGFKRLSPGKDVRLKYAYIIKCEKVIKNKKGEVIELRCSYDPESKSGEKGEGRKVQGTIHWLSAKNAAKAEVRLYDRLFLKEDPLETEEGKEFIDYLNPNSLTIVGGFVEAHLKKAAPGSRYQFERLGYFNIDPVDSSANHLVFNRIITLKDTWAKNT